MFKRLMDIKNIPKNVSTTKVGEHIPSGFSMSTISSFKSIESEHDLYCRKDCIKYLWILKRTHNGDN